MPDVPSFGTVVMSLFISRDLAPAPESTRNLPRCVRGLRLAVRRLRSCIATRARSRPCRRPPSRQRFCSESFARTASGPSTRTPMFSAIATARSTRSALVARTPFASQRLSSSPTRTLPPASIASAT